MFRRGDLSSHDPEWRHRIWLLAAIPAVGIGASLKRLAAGAIAMSRTLAAACGVMIIALVSLWLSSRHEDRLELSANDEAEEQESGDVRRMRSRRPVEPEGPSARTELPSAETESPLAGKPAGLPDSERVLRVVLEGITEEDASATRITLTGVDARREWWPSHFRTTWPCEGLTNEFDLDPFFSSVQGATNWDLRIDELVVKVSHPLHLIEKIRIPLSRGVARKNGQTVYEARVRLNPGVPHVFWPELTLSVRDVRTRAHLENVELRCVPTAFMGLGQLPGGEPTFTSLGRGLSSPIVLRGGRETDAPEDEFSGLALGPAAGGVPQLLELMQPEATDRGVVVYARAPGYAWGKIVLDVSTGAERALLLGPATALNLQLANVQLERYAALETSATLWVRPVDGDRVWHQRLDEAIEIEGLQLENLEPRKYAVSVELGEGQWKKRPVLAREELTLVAGETYELELALADPPAPRERATLGGLVSFPAFGGEEEVRLRFYHETHRGGAADADLLLSGLQRVGGVLPTWSFRLEDLTVGVYQVQLRPFLKSWIIELPAGGREDVELVVPELSEVRVETVDARTGEPIPLVELAYRRREALPGQVSDVGGLADLEEPGHFRFRAAPGPASIWPRKIPEGLRYGKRKKDLQLAPGSQSVRLELEPVYAIRVEFRVGEAVLPRGDDIYVGLAADIRAVDHDGRLTRNLLFIEKLVEVSAPGDYEISFEGIGTDRFQPTPPRRVRVRPGRTTEVIVDLRRK